MNIFLSITGLLNLKSITNRNVVLSKKVRMSAISNKKAITDDTKKRYTKVTKAQLKNNL